MLGIDKRIWAVLANLCILGACVFYRSLIDLSKLLFPVCAFRAVTGVLCPVCGGTHAVECLFRGDVAGAVRDVYKRQIYSLNVPIFFLMSGFTFHAGQYDNLGQLVKRLAKSLLIPYVFLNLLAYPVFCYTQGRMPDLESAKQLFFGMLYGVGDAGSLRFNIPLWFLPCTCMIECLYYLLDKYSKKTKPIWVLVSAVLGYFSFPLFNIRLPWGLDAAFTGLVFFAVGHYFCKERADKALFKLNPFLGFVLMTVSNVGFNLLNHTAAPYVDFNAMMFGNIFLFYICAFSGCVSVVYLAKIFEKSKLLAYVGRSTLWVIGLHAVFALSLIHIYS